MERESEVPNLPFIPEEMGCLHPIIERASNFQVSECWKSGENGPANGGGRPEAPYRKETSASHSGRRLPGEACCI
jgi:hypothetical protein